MLSKSKVLDVALNIFVAFCDEYDVNGHIERDKNGEYFLVIVGPDGARQVTEVTIEFLQPLSRDLSRREGIKEVEDETLRFVALNYYEGDYSYDDFDYLDGIKLDIWDLLCQRH